MVQMVLKVLHQTMAQCISAYVGGPDFSNFQYDMVNMGKRQVGSTVKPYLYTLAMSEGMWPCDKVLKQKMTLKDANGNDWSPRNANKEHIGDSVTLQWGLQNSDNWISAYLMSQFTPEQLVRLMRSFGIEGQYFLPLDCGVIWKVFYFLIAFTFLRLFRFLFSF